MNGSAIRVIAATLVASTALAAAQPGQLRTLDDRFEPPRFTSLAAWNARAAYVREHVLASAGLLPMPKRTDLKPVVSGEIRHDDYTVSKVRFESLPGFYVTGNLYRPIGGGPFPAILSPHGHWPNGRLENTDVASIPGRAIGLARQGFVVFTYDMIGYGDSRQLTHSFGSRREALWGLSLGGLQLWNSIRSLDFLETLPYVRKGGFGATGESGGGTQTFLLAAVDTRVAVAAPVNMISLHMQGGCLCENMPGLRLDINNVEIAASIAPRPMLMVSATGDWTNETLEKEYPAVRAIYSLFGAAGNVDAVRIDAPHNYNKASREAVYAWMARWLQQAPADETRPEKPFTVESTSDLLVFPPGGRLPAEAVTADGLASHWIIAAQDRVTERRDISPVDPELDAALRHALGFGDPAALPAAAASTASTGRRIAVVATARPDMSRALQAAGFDVRPVKFTPRTDGESRIRHFETYNRSDASQRVADIVAALRAAPAAVLVADGEAGLPALLAAAVVPARRVIVDVDRFDLSSDRDFLNRIEIPGLRRAGDFTTAAYMAQGDVVAHNAGDRFAVPRIKVVTRRLTVPEIVTRAAAPLATVSWRKVEYAGCGVSFEVPASWQLAPGPGEAPASGRDDCLIDLRPATWERTRVKSDYAVDAYALRLSVTTGTLDETACDKGIVCRDGDDWYFEGRGGAHARARHVDLGDGELIVGRVETGAYGKNDGGYQGASDARAAVLSRNGRIANISGDREFEDDAIFIRIARSIVFRR